MNKALLPIALAVSAVAMTSPASAQWAQSRHAPPAYGVPGQYIQGHGHVRGLQLRLNVTQREIARLAQYRMISRSEYNSRFREARAIERRLYRNARDGRGLTRAEARDVERKLQQLERRIARDVRDGRQWRHRW